MTCGSCFKINVYCPFRFSRRRTGDILGPLDRDFSNKGENFVSPQQDSAKSSALFRIDVKDVKDLAFQFRRLAASVFKSGTQVRHEGQKQVFAREENQTRLQALAARYHPRGRQCETHDSLSRTSCPRAKARTDHPGKAGRAGANGSTHIEVSHEDPSQGGAEA